MTADLKYNLSTLDALLATAVRLGRAIGIPDDTMLQLLIDHAFEAKAHDLSESRKIEAAEALVRAAHERLNQHMNRKLH